MMTATQTRVFDQAAANLAAVIARGEDGRHQFKRDFPHVDSFASDLAGFANTGGGVLHADEQAVALANVDHIDRIAFAKYFERRYKKPLESVGRPFQQLLQNLNLIRDGVPNLAGMLLFGNTPQVYLPAFFVKAVAFPGTVLHDSRYLDNENIEGPLAQQFQHCMAFLSRNLHHVQGNRGFNSPGELEIPHHVLEEIVVNALVHRDYLISAPIKLLVYADRVEIVSPGHLPNHLDTAQIRFGMSNLRNPALASHAFHILPYQGIGSGIPRAIEDWPHIEFVDDRQGNQFRVTLRRSVVQPEKASEKASEKTSEKILAALSTNPAATIADLANQTAVSTRTIERTLTKLQQASRLVRVGAAKGGHWKVLDKP
jgi:predicted HTH transcriptional regulator